MKRRDHGFSHSRQSSLSQLSQRIPRTFELFKQEKIKYHQYQQQQQQQDIEQQQIQQQTTTSLPLKEFASCTIEEAQDISQQQQLHKCSTYAAPITTSKPPQMILQKRLSSILVVNPIESSSSSSSNSIQSAQQIIPTTTFTIPTATPSGQMNSKFNEIFTFPAAPPNQIINNNNQNNHCVSDEQHFPQTLESPTYQEPISKVSRKVSPSPRSNSRTVDRNDKSTYNSTRKLSSHSSSFVQFASRNKTPPQSSQQKQAQVEHNKSSQPKITPTTPTQKTPLSTNNKPVYPKLSQQKKIAMEKQIFLQESFLEAAERKQELQDYLEESKRTFLLSTKSNNNNNTTFQSLFIPPYSSSNISQKSPSAIDRSISSNRYSNHNHNNHNYSTIMFPSSNNSNQPITSTTTSTTTTASLNGNNHMNFNINTFFPNTHMLPPEEPIQQQYHQQQALNSRKSSFISTHRPSSSSTHSSTFIQFNPHQNPMYNNNNNNNNNESTGVGITFDRVLADKTAMFTPNSKSSKGIQQQFDQLLKSSRVNHLNCMKNILNSATAAAAPSRSVTPKQGSKKASPKPSTPNQSTRSNQMNGGKQITFDCKSKENQIGASFASSNATKPSSIKLNLVPMLEKVAAAAAAAAASAASSVPSTKAQIIPGSKKYIQEPQEGIDPSFSAVAAAAARSGTETPSRINKIYSSKVLTHKQKFTEDRICLNWSQSVLIDDQRGDESEEQQACEVPSFTCNPTKPPNNSTFQILRYL